ncbi:ATP-binding protein [Streptococcus phocae]|uniref:Histidine kinase n=1 Tax=Streptococcus phocae TaxID=119224 RepID=A0A0P6SI80_9STRE|nr:ATP-binding protein [Streptococcus phocae]KPJ21944.1 histidine kinase [Streptococcus phocae]
MNNLVLPLKLNRFNITKIVTNFNRLLNSSDSEILTVDMRKIEFAEPSGVISLYNMLTFATKRKDVVIKWLICEENSLNKRQNQAMLYLVDCGFFKVFDKLVYKEPELRSTTFEIQFIGAKQVAQWKITDFKNWLQKQTGRKNEFSSICVAIDEIFNNISDHSTEPKGCIFGQYYPNKKEIVIAVSDFGIGIPQSIKNKFKKEDPDNKLIEFALQEGVSAETIPQNRGAGLSNIVKTLTTGGVGSFTIISNCGIVSVSDNQIIQSDTSEESYPGTFFEIRIDVSNENLYDLEEEEEFEW